MGLECIVIAKKLDCSTVAAGTTAMVLREPDCQLVGGSEVNKGL